MPKLGLGMRLTKGSGKSVIPGLFRGRRSSVDVNVLPCALSLSGRFDALPSDVQTTTDNADFYLVGKFMGQASNVVVESYTSVFSNAVYDTDAQNIITAVETADGQALETVVSDAINAFVIGCKSDSIWTALSAGVFRLLAGPRTLAGIFKAGFGADPTNINFVSGDYSRATGLKGNGTNKTLNSNRPNNTDAQNSQHIGLWATEQAASGTYIGADTGAAGASTITASFTRSRSNTSNTYGATLTSPFIGVNRFVSGSYAQRFNGTTNTITQTSQTPSSSNIHIFSNNAGSSPTAFSDSRIAFYSIGPALPSGGLTLLRDRLDTYMTAIAGI
jgi:hypothetical protein